MTGSSSPSQATYKNQNEPAFQDALGRLLVESAGTIPDGLLVFLPSYTLLDKLLARWKVGGVCGCGWRRQALLAVVPCYNLPMPHLRAANALPARALPPAVHGAPEAAGGAQDSGAGEGRWAGGMPFRLPAARRCSCS